MIKIPVKIEIILKVINIFEFLSPEYLKTSISLLLKSFMKNNCVVIKKTNGNISKIVAGEFRSARNNGK